jgi:hypothetical protein
VEWILRIDAIVFGKLVTFVKKRERGDIGAGIIAQDEIVELSDAWMGRLLEQDELTTFQQQLTRVQAIGKRRHERAAMMQARLPSET